MEKDKNVLKKGDVSDAEAEATVANAKTIEEIHRVAFASSLLFNEALALYRPLY